MEKPQRRPLEGLRVLDFTHAAAGPFATMYLADMGAEVIKVERHGRGDGIRHVAEYYVALNRDKKDICIDLAHPEGVALARRIAAQCDIVVQNFRPGVMERLGLGFEDLRKLRQGLIFCSISAFGQAGPWADRPANDIILQSVSGLMGITGEEGGGPVRIGAPIADYASGLFGLSGVLAALYARPHHPEGQHIQVSMLDSAFAMMSNYIPSAARGTRIPRVGRGHAQIVPYQAFVCADGEYVMVGAFTQNFWIATCKALGKYEWIDDPRYRNNAARLKHRDMLLHDMAALFSQKPRDEWLAILEKADVPTSPVLELHDALRSEQASFTGALMEVGEGSERVTVARSPIRVDQWKAQAPSMAPSMGLHTEDVLSGLLGMDQSEIGDLASRSIIGLAGQSDRKGK